MGKKCVNMGKDFVTTSQCGCQLTWRMGVIRGIVPCKKHDEEHKALIRKVFGEDAS